MTKKSEEEAKAEITVHDGLIVDNSVVLREEGAVLRMTYEYPIKKALDNKYQDMLAEFNVNKSSNGVVVVPAPMHMNGTYLMMGTQARGSGTAPDKFWGMVRAYSSLRFNSEFVPAKGAKKADFVPYCMQTGGDRDARVVVPDAMLQAPVGFRYVVVLLSRGSLYLYGMRDSDKRVFRVPVPNMTFDSGHLCEGHQLNNKVHKLITQKTMDACAFSQLITAWEEAQWNTDLVGTLPVAAAADFLRWDIKGKHLATVAQWDALAHDYPMGGNVNRDTQKCVSVIDAYMKETDSVICSS